MNRVEPLICSV